MEPGGFAFPGAARGGGEPRMNGSPECASPPMPDRAQPGRANRVVLTAIRLGARVLSPAGRRARLLVLAYHRVLPHPDPMRPFDADAGTFGRHMELLASAFRVMPLTEAIERIGEGNLPAHAACVTFDDGYADNYDVAMPVLRRCGVPATFFVAVGYLDGGLMWNDAIIEAVRQARGPSLDLRSLGLAQYQLGNDADRAQTARAILLASRYLPFEARAERVRRVAEAAGEKLPVDLMMTSTQVRALAQAGLELGGHTISHPILARLTPERAWHEIYEGKRRLERIAGVEIRAFAYPNGRPGLDYDASHVDMVRRAGFAGAVTTAWGAARAPFDRYQLPRVMPRDDTVLRAGLRLLQAYRIKGEVCGRDPEAAFAPAADRAAP